jgi:hypothetical protein
MKVKSSSYHFTHLKHRYRLLRGTEIVLWSLAFGLVGYFFLKMLSVPLSICFTVSFVLIVVTCVVGSKRLHIFSIQEQHLTNYINQKYPALENSVDLLLCNDSSLSSLQQLQKIKTIDRLNTIYPEIRLPHHLGKAFGVLCVGLVVAIGLSSFSSYRKNKQQLSQQSTSRDSVTRHELASVIKSVSVTILPPAYMGLSPRSSNALNLSMPEGSSVSWDIVFAGKVKSPCLIFSGRDTIQLQQSANSFKASRSFMSSGFYQLGWIDANQSNHFSDYYKVEVIKDQPPDISIENLNQFTQLSAAGSDDLKINLKTILADDYGLTTAHIVATVSKGSGEAIKFREEKLMFQKPNKILGRKVEARRQLDLATLGLLPGDELYFYVEALDNKKPLSNRARSETYFISIQDTSSLVTSVDASLGVDLMPEYFRSQRQIIIDTEKLLKEKNDIAKDAYNGRSNELGHDQKVLRLRYGQFLGEEFETGIGPQHEAGHDDEKVEERFGHVHDKENDHNLVPDKKAEEKDHDHQENDQGEKNPLEEFVHAHDNPEEATFFIQSIKAKLKAAITIMWDAELHLRLYEPEKSLPFQYKALKLLKEISQDSRIYVHRTGFDPPPLKEEKRLTGDLDEIVNSISHGRNLATMQYPAITKAIQTIEPLLLQDTIVISEVSKKIFIRAGEEVAAIVLEQARHLQTLSLLKKITQNEISTSELKSNLITLRTSLWRILPSQSISPSGQSQSTHELDLMFANSLEALNQKK